MQRPLSPGRVLLGLAALTLLVCTVASERHWQMYPLVLAAEFRLQYAWLALALCALLSLTRQYVWLCLTGGVLAVNSLTLTPHYWPPAAPAESAATVKILLANVNAANTDYARVLAYIAKQNPDLVALLETNGAWQTAMAPLTASLPFHQASTREDSFGLALYSRLPVTELTEAHWGPLELPSLVARLTTAHGELTLVATHPMAPVSGAHVAARDLHINQMAAALAAHKAPLVLLGDLNTTPWSQAFGELTQLTGLRDAREGFGVLPTWPALLPAPLRVPIDHCLVSPSLAVVDIHSGPALGSDHLPLVVTLALAPEAGETEKR